MKQGLMLTLRSFVLQRFYLYKVASVEGLMKKF